MIARQSNRAALTGRPSSDGLFILSRSPHPRLNPFRVSGVPVGTRNGASLLRLDTLPFRSRLSRDPPALRFALFSLSTFLSRPTTRPPEFVGLGDS